MPCASPFTLNVTMLKGNDVWRETFYSDGAIAIVTVSASALLCNGHSGSWEAFPLATWLTLVDRLGRKAAMRHALHRLRFAPTITVANPDAPTRRKYLSLWRRAAFRFRSRSANVMGVALARLEAQWCLARHLSMWKAARERRQRIRRGLDLIRNKIEKPRARTAFRRWLTSTVVCLRKHADLKRVTRHRRMLRTLRVWVGHAAHRRRSRLLIGRMLGLSRTMPVRYAFARWRQVAFAERHAERRRYLLHSIARRIADRNPVRVAFQTWRLNAFRNNLPGVDTVPFDMFACVVRQRIRSKTWSRWRSRWLLRRSARQALSRLVNVARIATMRLALNRLRERVLSSSSATVLFKAFLALRLNVKLKRTRNRKLGMALGRHHPRVYEQSRSLTWQRRTP